MSRFNLVREKWISVITENSGTTKEVSLLDIFENAEDYISIAGDSKAQDFAVLRILLSILHTVFSRYDFEGEAYEFIELDDNMIPISSIDLDNEVDYEDSLYETWQKLWGNGKFPVIVREYLEKWEEHFYLLDDKYPFLQVIEGDLTPDKISKSKASSFSGRNLNRLISESGNKIALFSPKYSDGINKDLLTFSEIARWTIALHGYIGLSDKVMFGKEKYKSSKGWLFDLGGIYIEGNNLFETLMLNLILVQEDYNYKNSIQMPAWEMNSEEVIKRHFNINNPDNISELYTRWSRAIYIDPEIDIGKPFNMSIVKLPDLDHCDYFLEPMTIWKYNRDGENKGKSTPRKHRLNQSLWRSFGLLTLSSKDNEDEKYRRPGVINWLNKQRKFIGNTNIKDIAADDITN